MKAYVIKNKQLGYMTETRDFINSLYQADFFDDYELAQCYCPTMTLCDCEVVEVQLMETKDLADYTKQVRKEICESIKEQFEKKAHLSLSKVGWEYQITEDEFDEFLDQIQGETK